MAEFRGRDLRLVKKALAIAVLAIERQPGDFQPFSDQTDMKALLEVLIQNDPSWSIMRARRGWR